MVVVRGLLLCYDTFPAYETAESLYSLDEMTGFVYRQKEGSGGWRVLKFMIWSSYARNLTTQSDKIRDFP